MKFSKLYKRVNEKWVDAGYICPACNGVKMSLHMVTKHHSDKCPKAKQKQRQKEKDND